MTKRVCCELCLTYHDYKIILMVLIAGRDKPVCLQCMYSIKDAYNKGRYANG